MKASKRVLATSVLVLLFFGTWTVHAQEKPNVVFMLMDNLGWGEVSTYDGQCNSATGTEQLTWVLPAVTYEILEFQQILQHEPPAPEPYKPNGRSK